MIKGNPLVMVTYALAVVHMIRHLQIDVPDASQACSLQRMLLQLDHWQRYYCNSSTGPDNEYFTNATKTVFIMKPGYLSDYQALFANTDIQIIAHGQQPLDAVNVPESSLRNMPPQRLSHWLQRFWL